MEKVTGIGGLFFRARDPDGLAAWYRDHLGVDPVPTDYAAQPWRQEAGPTAFSPFPHDTKYLGDPDKSWMVNFRVRNLDAMVKQLRDAAIAVEVVAEAYPNGRFAHLSVLVGFCFVLWQPN